MDYYSWSECKQLLLTQCRITDNKNNTYFSAECSPSLYKGNKKLKRSIEFYTSFLTNPTNTERWFYILHNIKEHLNPICLHCGETLTKFKKLSIGYPDYCSVKCQANSKERKEKTKTTSLRKYGVENPSQSKEIREKYKKTCQEKYGVENISQAEFIKEKKKETCLEHFGVKFPMQAKEISSQVSQTWKNKSDEEYADRLLKTRETKIKKYGDPNYHNTDKMNQTKRNTLDEFGNNVFDNWAVKMRNTMKEKYGDENYRNMEKIKQTYLIKYGNENYRNVEKARQTYFERTGYYHNSQNPDSNASNGGYTECRWYSENLMYRGNYELDFINLWLEFYSLDTIQNAEFIRYIHNEKEHLYFPDFEITYPNGKKAIVEIKGKHPFFYNSIDDGSLLAKWNATERFIENNSEYVAYYFILNGELVTKSEVFF
jgi:hypothetical protein